MQILDDLRDLSDFCNMWEHLRGTVVVGDEPVENLSPAGRMTLNWMILLADRACLSDDI